MKERIDTLSELKSSMDILGLMNALKTIKSMNSQLEHDEKEEIDIFNDEGEKINDSTYLKKVAEGFVMGQICELRSDGLGDVASGIISGAK